MTPLFRILAALLLLFVVGACDGEDDPPEYTDPAPFTDGKDGSPCVSGTDCLGGTCIAEIAGWRNGYCTTLGCDQRDCNRDDAVCLPIINNTASCFDGCETDEDCRPAYYCAEQDGQKYCSARFEDGPVPGETGARCEVDNDCNRGMTCDTSFPGGYCLSPECQTCIGDGVCTDNVDGYGETCFDGCTRTVDCRTGYLCKKVALDDICLPSNTMPPIVDFETTEQLLGITCGATNVGEGDTGMRWEIQFEVPEGVSSYVVTPLVPTGLVSPLEITGPSVSIDLIDTYKHHNLRATELTYYDDTPVGRYAEFAFDWPIGVPYAPQFANLVEPGTHTMRLTTTSAEPCIYVVGGNPGSTIDLNIYLVGEMLDAAQAGTDPDLAEVLQVVRDIYEPAGIQLGSVQYYDAIEEARERYGVIRSFADIKRLAGMGEPRDPTLSGHLSADVFLVDDILIGGGVIVLGVSAGVPGPPGLHGNAGNGLVFNISDLGNDNRFVGYIMAHELGHYLGLRHTSEVVLGLGNDTEAEYEALVGASDPIMDTPTCDMPQSTGQNCPDFTNLLFPLAPPRNFTDLPLITEGQAEVMQLHPLVR